MAEGIERAGDKVTLRSDQDADMRGFDAAVFWGFVTSCQVIKRMCEEARIPWVYLDLGYWRRDTYYKVSVNDRHPTAYFQKGGPKPTDRWDRLALPPPKPWRREGQSIILAGMSGKAAWSWGFDPQQWETSMVAYLHSLAPERPIIYRPKPSWAGATPIDHSSFDKTTELHDLLYSAYAVVTHHSNVGCDALLEGVPVFTRHGAARPLALGDNQVDQINSPIYPDGREQWAADLAYCQWSTSEMANGECWRHLKSVFEFFPKP